MPRNKIPETVQQEVRQRASYLCEYCHASEQWQYIRFTIDHIVPLTQDGTNQANNLALACFHCNRRKSDRLTGIDPDSGQEIALFHPRRDRWADHFVWAADGLQMIGLTATGRATIATLNLNRERVLSIRAADKAVGRHPPDGDPIQSAE